ncbi:PAS domain-containing protein [Shewanella amazonensis]|uniref:Multi-sensor signal transduction histidine kinase n=1 Tax=Shewanella amazonensis (strain ATCC BAA-1098 / SB2B) TaxID=326297 RepID=A1S704_SHEAM|nr:PAS domain-containing protein [Shewanella amazonensis]ABM00161.1 multi-sensor signal transduction histidine kinase [Shewanella amazonensis SB2B]
MNRSKAYVSHTLHPRWRNSLPFRVGLLQSLIATLLLLATLWILLGSQKEERLAQEMNLNLSQGQLVQARLRDLTAQLDTLVVAIADVAGTQRNDIATIENTIPSLLSLPNHKDVVASGGIWPEKGHPLGQENESRSLFWVRDLLGQLRKNDGYNQSSDHYFDELWYKPMRLFPAGRVFWSPSYIDPHTQESMVTASVPIWQEHEFQGVATIDVSLSSLSSYLTESRKELGGYVILLDQFNQVLSAPLPGAEQSLPEHASLPDLATLTQRYPQLSALLSLVEDADTLFIKDAQTHQVITQEQFLTMTPSNFPLGKQMYQAIINTSALAMPQSPVLLATLAIDADPLIAAPSLVSVYRMPGTFWKVITVTPKSSFKNEALLLVERAGLYLLLAQVLALLLMIFVQHKLYIKPIARMVSALKAEDAAHLELQASQREDEIGVLASALVARTHQLEIAMASLDASNLALEQQLEVQQEAQQDLLAHKERLTALLKSSPNLIFIKDIAGRYLMVNDKFCETIGLDRHRILGATDRQLFSSDLAQAYGESDQRVMTQDAPLQFEETLPTRLGEIRFQMTKFAIRDDDDNLRGTGAIAFDIQNRKRIEKELLERITTLEHSLSLCSSENGKLQQKLQLAEFELSQKTQNIEETKAKGEAWGTERRLFKSWLRDLVSLIAREQENLLAKACNPGATPMEKLKDALSEHAERLRVLELLTGRHKASQRAVPMDVLQQLTHLFQSELAGRDIQIRLEGERNVSVQLETWQLTLLIFSLLKLLCTQTDNAPQGNIVTVCVDGSGPDCLIRFDSQGASSDIIAPELSALTAWLERQFGGSLTLCHSLTVATIVDCRLPFAD